MANNLANPAAAICAIALAGCMGSCVDNDYDLSKDIDLTVNIGGGELALPASSTDELTLSQILDLNDESSIKTVDEATNSYGNVYGDYVLMQSGTPSTSVFSVPEVSIDDLSNSGSTYTTDLDPFVNPGTTKITQNVNPTLNTIDLSDDDVTRDLVSLDEATTEIDMTFTIGYNSSDFSGYASIDEGYKAVFDDSWTLEIVDATTAQFLRVDDTHRNIVYFTSDKKITSSAPAVCNIRLTHIDFTSMPEGQGLYERGKFHMDTKVESEGTVSISGEELAVGSTANLELVVTTAVSSADLIAITGIVDPEINVNTSEFAINDIPDFLKEPGNNLDINNPQIYLTVNNTSPVAVNLNGQLVGHKDDGSTVTVGIGQNYGTSPIVLQKNTVNLICISRTGTTSSQAGIVDVTVPDLGNVLASIPETISFENIDAKATQQPVTLTLDTDYSFTSDYEAYIPLAFGPDFRLIYNKIDAGWDEDLEKYDFNEVHITLNVINSIPMDMVPEVIALDHNENPISNITATITGVIDAGTPASPKDSSVSIILKSTAGNMKELDGVKLVFNGTTKAEYVGTNLNATQTLKFTDIRISVVGGVTIDLND